MGLRRVVRCTVMIFAGSLAIGVVAACANKGADAPANGGVPVALSVSLRDQITAAKPGASPIAEGVAIRYLDWHQAEVPDPDVFANDADGADRRGRRVSRLSPSGKDLVAQMRRQCQISPQQRTFTGEFKVGSQATTTVRSSISGSFCPYIQSEQSTIKLTFDAIDLDTHVFSAHGEGTVSVSERMQDDGLVGRTGLRGLEATLAATVRAFNAGPGGEAGSEHESFSGSGAFIGGDGARVPFELTGEELRNGALKQKQMLLTVHHPAGDVTVGGIADGSGVIRVYVNGVTQPQGLATIFGFALD